MLAKHLASRGVRHVRCFLSTVSAVRVGGHGGQGPGRIVLAGDAPALHRAGDGLCMRRFGTTCIVGARAKASAEEGLEKSTPKRRRTRAKADHEVEEGEEKSDVSTTTKRRRAKGKTAESDHEQPITTTQTRRRRRAKTEDVEPAEEEEEAPAPVRRRRRVKVEDAELPTEETTPAPTRKRRAKASETEPVEETLPDPAPARTRAKRTKKGELAEKPLEEEQGDPPDVKTRQTPVKAKAKKTKTKVLLSDLAVDTTLPPLPPKKLPPPRPRAGDGEAPAPKTRKPRAKRTVRVEDLPQGLLPPDPRDAEPPNANDEPAPAYPTVMLQARRNMDKFHNCVLLTRVGGFYELYFEHADEFGPALNLKVVGKRTAAGVVSMAGFPFFQLDRHLKLLVQDLGRFVAVAEEFPNSAGDRVRMGGLMNDRRIARIITPGTLIDENFMDPFSNNFVMAIHAEEAVAEAAEEAEQAEEVEESEQAEDAEDANDIPQPAAPASLATPELRNPTLGLAWVDISTGQFYTQSTTLASLASILSRVSPREVVLPDALQSDPDHALFSVLAEDRHMITYAPLADDAPRTVDDWTPMLESEVPAQTRASFLPAEIASGNLLLGYVLDRLRGMNMRLQPPQRREDMHIMAIDKNSMRSLEIKQTIRDANFKGSLLHAIRRTVTRSGARLLSDWLSSPSTSLPVIKARQDLVARFLHDQHLRDNVVLFLHRSHDSQRLVQKFTMGKGDPDDLLALAQTIHATDRIVALLKEAQASSDDDASDPPENDNNDPGAKTTTAPKSCLAALVSRIDLAEPLALAQQIRSAIDEAGLMQQHEIQARKAGELAGLALDAVRADGSAEDENALPQMIKRKLRTRSLREFYNDDDEDCWMMRPDASPRLQDLHAELRSLHREREALEESLRARFDASSLTLKSTATLGHVCHIRGARDMRSDALAEFKPISSSRSTRSFHLPEWTFLGGTLDQARFQIRAEEQRVLHALRQQVMTNLVRLRRNAAVVDELDIATSFAKLAVEQSLTRPLLNNSTSHVIVGGRHPTVEGGLHEQGRSFVRNDCYVGASEHGRLWLITGPNMAGKSTFLRQNALITILAQVGCYVPADYAELGIVDAVFSRVGSADNLFRDQSTFMVEMLETAQILRSATPRSFVIMDEIGRGTTPEDGSAVAFASLHHLVAVNQCRTLFATHFHGVVDRVVEWGMDRGNGGAVEMYCNDVEEDVQGGFIYIHKLRKGTNRQSHALKVARIAGLPAVAMDTARRVLDGAGQAAGSASGADS